MERDERESSARAIWHDLCQHFYVSQDAAPIFDAEGLVAV